MVCPEPPQDVASLNAGFNTAGRGAICVSFHHQAGDDILLLVVDPGKFCMLEIKRCSCPWVQRPRLHDKVQVASTYLSECSTCSTVGTMQ